MSNWKLANSNVDNIQWHVHSLPNIPIFKTKLDKHIISVLWSYIEKAEELHNDRLAGNITKSLVLEDKDDYFFHKVLEKISYKYLDPETTGFFTYHNNVNKIHSKVILDSMWVNYQYQTEFNPGHDHHGLFSFIIWMKIPTDCKEQHETIPFCKHSNSKSVSNVEFQYSDILGNHQAFTISMNSEMENMMVVFPSKLRHQVYPFYNCDEARISIAGNICFDGEEYIDRK